MSDISEFDKIHNYVTWPDRERKFFPNGDVTIGALGFPVANQSGVANDGTCNCAEGVDECTTPPTVDVEFNVSHKPTDPDAVVTKSDTYVASTHIDIITVTNESFDDMIFITVPAKRVEYNRDDRLLNVTLFDDAQPFKNYSNVSLVKSINSNDSLTTTNLLTTDLVIDHYECSKTNFDVDNSFDLPEITATEIENSKFAVRFEIPTESNSIFVYLTNQNTDATYGNGVYEIVSGTMSYIAASLYEDEMSEADCESLLNDGRPMDNVGTCCGPHFRKTYAHDEIHDYVYNKVGSVIGFGVYSNVSGCQGALIDWLTSNGTVDISNRKGFPVYVNGFGLGSFFVGQTSYKSATDNTTEDNVETIHPWLLWSYGTTMNELSDSNIPALPRDWPFTYASESFNRLDDVSSVTLVKRGVTIDGLSGQTFGNLYTDILDEHDTVVGHRFYNKHHFVLNQKYKREEGGGYEVKPFFINLPAPIDTEDGETYEITVSIQNQPDENLGTFVNAKDLSAYYASMSQPRVYVMGGFQQFSNKKLIVTKSNRLDDNPGYVLTTDRVACAVDGTPLPDGTEVRANVVTTVLGNTLPTFNAFGTITQVLAVGNTPAHTEITVDSQFPADRNYTREGATYYICGMAYIGDDDNPSNTRMGLVRDVELFRGANGNRSGINGSGVEGALDEYNTFFSVDKQPGHRALPHVDRRYYLASVYQTATNTFPWRLNNRRKLQRLDRVATDISGDGGIIKMVYDVNRKMLFDNRFSDIVYDTDGEVAVSAVKCPVSYATTHNWSNLGSVLRIGLPKDLIESSPITLPYGNPVRQAAKAMKDFTTDLYNMRMLVKTDGRRATEVATKYLSIRERTAWPLENDELFNDSDIDYDVSRGDSIRTNVSHSTLRSLPEYVVKADLYELSSQLYPNADSVLFTEEGVNAGTDVNPDYHGAEFFEYYNTSPYNKYDKDVYASTEATGENKCDLTGNPTGGRVFSKNSLIEALLASNGKIKRQMPIINDMRRYADVGLRIEIPNSYTVLTSPDNAEDWYRPFTNLSYRDGAPSVDYDDTDIDQISESQQQWFSFDAVQMYRFIMDDADNDPVETVSTVMPYLANNSKSEALAKFIEKYVVGRGADMPIHFYKGRRVELKDGTLPDKTSDIYINEIYRVQKRLESECSLLSENLTKYLTYYLNDNFEAVTRESRNPNADFANLEARKYALDATVPPYMPSPDYTNAETYTRVRMQFTFSQRAGRWYTTEYRQYPCCYLSPLYGNDALALHDGVHSMYDDDGKFSVTCYHTGATTVNDTHLWRNPACIGFNNYKNVMYAPYSSYPSMDITLGCVPYLYNKWPYKYDTTSDKYLLIPSLSESHDVTSADRPYLQKLEQPWLEYRPDYGTGGISLYPPANVSGGHETATDNGVHANFWSVRAYVRPATSILPGTDVPKYEDPDKYDATVDYRKGGLDSDPTLYSMFDFPKSGEVIYSLPDVINPSEDIQTSAIE